MARKRRAFGSVQRKKVSDDPSIPRTEILTAAELKEITAKIDEERRKRKKKKGL